jgi:dihydropyrimidinase
MYPQKGCIAPGSDADIVILDTSVNRKITYSDLHLNDYTPWEGWEVECWPSTVTLRGKIMIEDNQFFGDPSDGKLVKRKISSDVLAKPL